MAEVDAEAADVVGFWREAGSEAWFGLDPAELLGEDAAFYEKVSDVLDPGFDAGISHLPLTRSQTTPGWPADLYCEGSDQQRSWFQYALLTAVATRAAPPCKTLISHAVAHPVHSGDTGTAAETLLAAHGADVLRLPMVADARVAGRVLGADRRRVVGRGVVADDQLDVAVGLVDDRFDRLAQVMLPVVDRQPDADFRIRGLHA